MEVLQVENRGKQDAEARTRTEYTLVSGAPGMQDIHRVSGKTRCIGDLVAPNQPKEMDASKLSRSLLQDLYSSMVTCLVTEQSLLL